MGINPQTRNNNIYIVQKTSFSKILTGAKKSTKKGLFGVITPGKSSGPRVCTLDDALSLANTAISWAVNRPVQNKYIDIIKLHSQLQWKHM